MKRRTFITALSGAAAWSFACRFIRAAEYSGAFRVGVILHGGDYWYEAVDGLREDLNRLGWVEGKNFILDIQDTHGDLQAVEQAAAALEQQKVSLIYSLATSVTLAVKRATARTPIVFVAGTDPVTVALVESLSRPGGRLTGFTFERQISQESVLKSYAELCPTSVAW
jgi:putative ABC transport system substrate-binding protein